MDPNEEIKAPSYTKTHEFHLVKTEVEANALLSSIISGYIGFDTEYVSLPPSGEELGAIALTQGTKLDRLQYHRNRLQNPEFAIDWDTIRFPEQLRRILESSQIAKVGTGFQNDGKVIYYALGCNVRCFREAGSLIRLVHPDAWANHGGPVSLEDMVESLFGKKLDKDDQLSDWRVEYFINSKEIQYAGLDAQASRDVYSALLLPTRYKEQQLNRLISDDWFVFDFVDGEARTISTGPDGSNFPWKFTLCPWYRGGRFAGYHA
ncbi:ribonuclease H-like domain-containing protein [Mycena filopes]|nr:ribonuclease H-like domain-containing protein [Mycena filopes]